MNNFIELKNGTEEQQKEYNVFHQLLLDIFQKDDNEYIIDSTIETKTNHEIIFKYIIEPLKIFNSSYKLSANKKLIRQTLKYVVEHLNKKYKTTSGKDFIILTKVQKTVKKEDGKVSTIQQLKITL